MIKHVKTALVGTFALMCGAIPLQADYYDNNYYTNDCNPCCYDYNPCCCDRFWGSAEYLYWKIQDASQPVPLALEGSEPVPTLDNENAHIVLGGKKIKNDWMSGGRVTVGGWFDDCKTFGAEASYFLLPYHTEKSTVVGSGILGAPSLSVPFFNTLSDSEAAYPVAFFAPGPNPQALRGRVFRQLRNRMQGAELNGILTMPSCDCNLKVGLLAGFRWWNFDESLTFKTDNTFAAVTPVLVNVTKDKFAAQNNFYGGQLGIGLDYTCGCFFFDVKGKVALGANCSKLDIHGDYLTNRFNPGFPLAPTNAVFFEGGLFAQGTNSGSHKKTYFAVIPEVSAKVGFQINDCLRISVGYNFLWINKVIRPAKLIDRNINPSQSVALTGNPNATLIGDPAPLASTKTSSFWAQGLTAGFDFAF